MSIEGTYRKIFEDISSIQREGVTLKITGQGILSLLLLSFGGVILTSEIFGGIGMLFSLLILLVSVIMLYTLGEYILFIRFLSVIQKYNPLIYSKESDLEKMILVLQKIYRITAFFRYIKPPKMISTYYPDTLIQNEFQFLLLRLSEMRYELQRKIESQIGTLESSKESIEGISGSSEITQIFELQKAHLHRQIEQFEALQKILTRA